MASVLWTAVAIGALALLGLNFLRKTMEKKYLKAVKLYQQDNVQFKAGMCQGMQDAFGEVSVILERARRERDVTPETDPLFVELAMRLCELTRGYHKIVDQEIKSFLHTRKEQS